MDIRKYLVFIFLTCCNKVYNQTFYFKPIYTGAFNYNEIAKSDNIPHASLKPGFSPGLGTYLGYQTKKGYFMQIGRRTLRPVNKIIFDTEGGYPANGKSSSYQSNVSTFVNGGGLSFFDNYYQYSLSLGIMKPLNKKIFIAVQSNFILNRHYPSFYADISKRTTFGTDTLTLYYGKTADSLNYWSRQFGLNLTFKYSLTKRKSVGLIVGYTFPNKILIFSEYNLQVNNSNIVILREVNRGRLLELGVYYSVDFSFSEIFRRKKTNS